jgi:hypothetical protein
MRGLASRSGALSKVEGNAIYKPLYSWRSDDTIGFFGLDEAGFLYMYVYCS